jgi:hypothetical protein
MILILYTILVGVFTAGFCLGTITEKHNKRLNK